MGILRSSDGHFILANKNGQPAFTGATVDLAPYCGQIVEVDGLLVGDPEITPGLGNAKLFQVQTIRAAGADKAAKKANLWTKDWKKRNPDVGGKGPWFKRDPKVAAEIEANGRLGLGAEADQAVYRRQLSDAPCAGADPGRRAWPRWRRRMTA